MLKAAFQSLVGKAAVIDSRATGDSVLQLTRELYGFAHVAYLALATLLLPALWADPLGPLLKVAPIVVLILVALAILEER